MLHKSYFQALKRAAKHKKGAVGFLCSRGLLLHSAHIETQLQQSRIEPVTSYSAPQCRAKALLPNGYEKILDPVASILSYIELAESSEVAELEQRLFITVERTIQ